MLLEKDDQATRRRKRKCPSLLRINTVQDHFLKEHLHLRKGCLRFGIFRKMQQKTIVFNSISGRHGSGSESPKLRTNTSPGPGNYETNRSTLDNHALVK